MLSNRLDSREDLPLPFAVSSPVPCCIRSDLPHPNFEPANRNPAPLTTRGLGCLFLAAAARTKQPSEATYYTTSAARSRAETILSTLVSPPCHPPPPKQRRHYHSNATRAVAEPNRRTTPINLTPPHPHAGPAFATRACTRTGMRTIQPPQRVSAWNPGPQRRYQPPAHSSTLQCHSLNNSHSPQQTPP